MKFVHLHTHSHYSLLDGLIKPDDLVRIAKEEGATCAVLTDHGVMYGAIEFYQKCKKAGIKPIIGVEMYLTSGSRLEKNSRTEERNYHLILLAKDIVGYKNLIKLTTLAHLEGFYYKPRIDWEILTKYKDGLIALTACLAGEIPRLIQANNLEKCEKRLLEYKELFGNENFYLELQHHPNYPEQINVNQQLIEFSKKLDIPLVVTNDVHYLAKDDDEAQDILLCLQTKKKKEDRDRLTMVGENFSFRSSKEMLEIFKDTPEAISNTVKIAEQCNLEIKLNEIQLPYFSVPDGYDCDSYLAEWSKRGLIERYGCDYQNVEEVIRQRMDYELSVIKKMGWSSYFLIVADFVNWAKNNKIVVGPGRGSAAGSLVCYLINITNIDPLKYDLLFERFLNPDRVSMPDIDMDFADIRRDEVIRYVEEKYGKDHVAQIITFGTMAARAAIRDVGRVLNYPYDYCDKLSKMIPPLHKIDQALKEVSEFKNIYKNEDAAKKIIDYAKRLEGVARHASTHACGVIITKEPLTEYVPLQYASSSDRTIVSQYSLHPVEDLGLLKMDFLGLKNLTIIESAIKIIKNTQNLDIDVDKIPLDDKPTYKLFQKGETTGVFQFESSGMKRYLHELKPTEFEDIIAMVALYRPGPMEWIPDYIAGKSGKKKPVYLHIKLEPILVKTYGVAIYQEQVMQIVRDLAGFTMAEADVLRKAVGKKIVKLLNEQKEKFVDGCVKNGIASQLAEKIFSFIEPFAGYGFNRSHAACYALIGYQTAYLKSKWPTEFMAALLTADQQNIDRIAIEIEECRHMGIDVLSPDINQSFESFTAVVLGTETSKTIRFGLKAVKNIGDHIAEVIIEERKNNGLFKDLSDFLERICDKDLNKKSLESLIKCGGLDQFGERGQLLKNVESMLEFNRETSKTKNNGQTSLFGEIPSLNLNNKIKLENALPVEQSEKLAWEKELLGLYITGHPFLEYESFVDRNLILPIAKMGKNLSARQILIAGIIIKIQKITTRSNESMLFVKIEDSTGVIESLVFPSLLKENVNIWQEGKAVICQGKLSNKDQQVKFLCNRVVELVVDDAEKIIAKFIKDSDINFSVKQFEKCSDPILPSASAIVKKVNQVNQANQANTSCLQFNENKLYVLLDNKINPIILAKLKELLIKHNGDKKVYFKIRSQTLSNKFDLIETDFAVDYNNVLIKNINSLLSSNFVGQKK
ncbi:MAG: DNA polymerase III subunit alpha [bacterium]|nr:DNA polymerase III subunit alpha [bacterium]